MVVQCVAGSQKRLRFTLGFHGTDFNQTTPTKLKKKKTKLQLHISELTRFVSRALFQLGFQCGGAEGTAGGQVIHF